MNLPMSDIHPILSRFANDNDRWHALLSHDPAADRAFVFAVATTGIYCRPSCPSRRAKRENVRFYASCIEAEQAGFRPCKRCQPNEPAPAQRRADWVAVACRAIEQAERPPTLEALASIAGMSRFHFQRVFKAVTGVSPRDYSKAHRRGRVHAALASNTTVTDAIYDAGFSSNGRFYAASNRLLGMTPGAYQSNGADTSIRFAVGECRLGSILVAATDKGVCAVSLGDDPDALARDLQDRFSKARLIGGDADFEQWIAKVVGFIDSPMQGLDLPLDIRGTAFQQQVWQALRDIPFGSTASYAEIAKRIGRPTASRAVAQACGANPVAVLIPCHRVVRTDGGLSGYRWGVERKRALLEHEALSKSRT